MIVTLTGPSAVGKGTQAKLLGAPLVRSVGTRNARPSDLPGEHVKVSKQEFESCRARGEFLWTVQVHGEFYATEQVAMGEAVQARDLRIMILTPNKLETVHALAAPAKVVSIFLQPPSEAELYHRLLERGESCAAAMQRIRDCRDWEDQARNLTIPVHFVPPGTIDETHNRIKAILSRLP